VHLSQFNNRKKGVCMEAQVNELTINGTIYVPKNQQQYAEKLDNMPYCIVRTFSAGVFIGYIKSRTGREVKMVKARRVWYWSGAASLSQLAVEGTSKPRECKIAIPVNIELLEVIEILDVTAQAKINLDKVAEWRV
jgi:hypothetical protein